MWEWLAILAVGAVVGLVALGAGLLALARLGRRLERRLGRATRGPARPGRGRSARGGTGAGRTPGASTGRRAAGATKPPRFRIRSVFEPRPEMRWHGLDDTLRVHALTIPSPLAYVAADHRATGIGLDPSEIIPSLPVDGRVAASPAPDWPRYDGLTPSQRWAYLSWMSGGRAEAPGDPALAMLHFSGLERRVLVDRSDLGAVVHEVCRVRDLVHRALAGAGEGTPALSRRWAGYMRQSGSLLWALVGASPESFTERDVRVLASRATSWSQDALASLLAWCVRRGGGVAPPWVAMIAAREAPGARRSVVVDRVPDEFAALFGARLGARFPDGMVLRAGAGVRALAYRPCNASIAALDLRLPDVAGLASQFGPLVEIWNACIEDLRGVARAGVADGEMTLSRWDALPSDVRATLDHPFASALASVAGECADASGHAIVPVRRLAAAFRIEVGDRATLTPTQSRAIAGGVEGAGMGLEPDARLSGVAYGREAEVVLLSAPIPWRDTPEARRSYLAASCVLRLGAAVAMADGEATDRELGPIAAELERAFDLTEDDHRRLEALSVLLRARGSDVRSVGKRLIGILPPEARRSIGALLVAVARADGGVVEPERSALNECARALGLEPGEIESLLLRAEAPATAERGHPGRATPALTLDRAALDRVAEETRQVAALLAEAMRSEEPEGPEAPDAGVGAEAPEGEEERASIAVASAPPGPAGLHPRFAGFYRTIVSRASWPLDEAGVLAREHRLMLSGAVEAVNDWSYDRAAGPVLVEDGDRLVVDQDRLRMMG